MRQSHCNAACTCKYCYAKQTTCVKETDAVHPVQRYHKGHSLLAEDPECLENYAAIGLVVSCTLEPASLPLLQLDELKHLMTDRVAQQKPRMHKQGV